MNVVQMHIAIQQGVDKINSLQADMLLSEEIDIELNKSMSRFLNLKYGRHNIYKKGFEESQKRIDDLRSLVNEYEAPVIFKEQYNNNIWIDQFRLPSDYLYLVNQRSEIYTNNCNSIGYSLNDDNPAAYFVLPVANLHNDTHMVNALTIVADVTNLGIGIAPVSLIDSTWIYPQDIQQLQDHLLNPDSWMSGFAIYWEMHGQLHYPNSFIVIVDTNQHSFMHWDSSFPNENGSSLITSLVSVYPEATGYDDPSLTEVVYAQYTDNSLGAKRIPQGNSEREYTFNKFVQHDDIFKLLEDPFNTTKHTAPLTTIRGEYIDIYTNDIFIIDKVKITYIRKPKQISLSLGIGCEFPDHTHQEIVDMTVNSILEGISDPRYASHQSEVSKNE